MGKAIFIQVRSILRTYKSYDPSNITITRGLLYTEEIRSDICRKYAVDCSIKL